MSFTPFNVELFMNIRVHYDAPRLKIFGSDNDEKDDDVLSKWDWNMMNQWVGYAFGINARIHRWQMDDSLTTRHPDSKVHEANMGPIWDRQDRDGPHIGPMNLAIRAVLQSFDVSFCHLMLLQISSAMLPPSSWAMKCALQISMDE